MIEPIAAPSGPAATWQANFAAMQQTLTQKMFQSADSNSNGSVSKGEFEAFYNKFMGSASHAGDAAQTAAADRLFAQLDPAGSGRIGPAQFSVALKQMMVQKAQGHPQASSVAGATASSAANKPTGLIGALLGGPAGSAAGQSAQHTGSKLPPGHNGARLEFVA